MSLCHQSLEELHSVAADWRFPPRARRSIFKSEDEMCTSKMNVGWNNMKHDLLTVLPKVQSSFSDFLTNLFGTHHLLNIFSVPSKSSKFQPQGCGILQSGSKMHEESNSISLHIRFAWLWDVLRPFNHSKRLLDPRPTFWEKSVTNFQKTSRPQSTANHVRIHQTLNVSDTHRAWR